MSERVAFAPKERFSDPDQLGSVFIGDLVGDLNVREAVAATGDDTPDNLLPSAEGYIIAEHPAVIRALDGYEALKRATVDDAEPKAAKPAKAKAQKEDED